MILIVRLQDSGVYEAVAVYLYLFIYLFLKCRQTTIAHVHVLSKNDRYVVSFNPSTVTNKT